MTAVEASDRVEREEGKGQEDKCSLSGIIHTSAHSYVKSKTKIGHESCKLKFFSAFSSDFHAIVKTYKNSY